MVSSPAPTWSTLTTQYAAHNWPPLAALARTYYAQRGLLVTAANYLVMSPAVAAEPFIGNAATSQLVKAALPAAGAADETYAQYVMRGADYAQPLLTHLTDVLQEQAITLADFEQQVVAQEGASYLTTLLGPSFWIPVTAAWQQQVQLQLDLEGRWPRLLAAQEDPVSRALLLNLDARLAAASPTASLQVVSKLPLNELARLLWVPAPAADDQFVAQLLGALQTAAQVVIAQNYPDAEMATRLVASVVPSLVPFAQVLLTAAEGNAAVMTVTELATAELGTLASKIAQLPANHPDVYALAAWVQEAVQRFLRLENADGQPVSPSFVPVRGQLLGAEDKPLTDFLLRITQTFSSRADAVHSLGEVRTGADGRFELTVSRDLYLDENDAVAEAPVSLRANVYYPGQDTAGEPEWSLALATGDDAVVYSTGLQSTIPAPTSQAVSRFLLPAALSELLAERGIASLADVRAAGGAQQLIAGTEDLELLAAARRLDGLAQFEVVSSDAAFHEQVVDKGFYSLAQLLDSTSQAEFVTLLEPDSGNEAQRMRATGFYQQAAVVQALSQTLGLLTSGVPAADFAPAARPPGVARFANLGQLADQGVIEGDSTTAAFGPDAGATTLPGYDVIEGFNAAPVGPELNYQPDGQCDCPACRSAVSPTAYLAALLKYAKENLRSTGAADPVTPQNLQEKFLQPYCDLAVNCQSADEQVCQYRLAIEIIQADWRQFAIPPADKLTLAAARPYVEGVLEALLQALGTSLAEVRTVTKATLNGLASRLQLPASLVSELQTRFSASQLADTRSLDAVEADLAELFGLASTAVDPLRTGLLLTPTADTDAIKLIRWNFQGVAYGTTTDSNGQVSIAITAGSRPHVVVYAGEPTEDNVVARGTLLESDSVLHTFTGLLYPQHGSGLSGSLVATVTGTEDALFTVAVVPAVTAGRQQVLAAQWLSQDASAVVLLRAPSLEAPNWNGFAFLVDPDLLGPDDFRPLRPGQANLGNRAYQLWRRRYDFLQDPLAMGQLTTAAVGTIAQLLDILTTNSLTYNSDGTSYAHIPWNTAELTAYANYHQQSSLSTLLGTAALAYLHADSAGNTAGAPLAAAALRSLGMSVESMERLYDLWQFNRTKELSGTEWQEALDIVRQSTKKAFEADWLAEEQGNNPIDLSYIFFQRAVQEPLVGIWQQVRPLEFGFTDAAQLPRIDPDEVTPLDLPDAGLGDQASKFWGDRQAELLQKRQAILASGASAPTAARRADAMLTYAYQANRFGVPPTTVLPGTPPGALATFEAVVAASQNSADTQQLVAQAYLAAVLNLRAGEAARLVELRAQVIAQPADTLWQEMAALLTLAWKRAVAYRQGYVPESAAAPAASTSPTNPSLYVASWLAQEMSVSAYQATPLDYLIGTRKHRLVKWRAEAATRAQWVQALMLADQRPLIDPDQLVPGDFRQAGERSRNLYLPPVNAVDKPYINPAFDLYQRRQQVVATWFNDQLTAWQATQAIGDATARQNAAWLNISNLLHSSRSELEALYTQQQAGVDVSPVLRRLQLTPDGLDLLVTQVNGLGADRAIEVPHLLTQVLRQRQYAAWAREEITLRIVPTPYYFRQPQAEAESLATKPWRSSAVERRQWQRNLTARFGQAEALTEAQKQAVKATEDQYLGLLRDALLMAKTGSGSDTLATRAAAMEEKYLLDFQTVCCQHTTRVAQASMMLQKLFADVRGGLASNGLALSQDDKTFESDWQWLSSFERWRSLMFLYLYPQNVLLPALKPGQTSQFRETVSAIRQAASTSPADARQYMDDYQAFMTDMGTLKIGAAMQTLLDALSPDGFQAATLRQPVSLQVATSDKKLAYVNLHYLDASGATTTNYSWARLAGEGKVNRVVGATVHKLASSGERYAYVFVLLEEEPKDTVSFYLEKPVYVAFQRLNLRTLSWDDDYTRLNINDTTTLDRDNILVAQNSTETESPVLVGLRNRRVPLYTETPFGLSAPASATTSRSVDYILGTSSCYNVDLFNVVLDSTGVGIGFEQTRTFLLVSKVMLMSCIQDALARLTFFLAVQSGYDSAAYLHSLQFFIENPNSAFNSRPKYIINRPLYQQTATQLVGSGTSMHTSYFQSALSDTTLLSSFVTAMRNLINNFNATYDNMATDGIATSTSGRDTAFAIAPAGDLVWTRVGARMTGGSQDTGAPATSNHYLRAARLNLYYNRNRPTANNSTSPKTYVVAIGFDSLLEAPHLGDDVNAPAAASMALTPVLNGTYPADNEYYFAGPLLRTGYNLANNGESFAPTCEVLGRYAGVVPINSYSVPAYGDVTLRPDLTSSAVRTLAQKLPMLPPIFSPLIISDLDNRAGKLQDINNNATTTLTAPGFISTLVSEGYYALPMLLAQELARGRNYELALHYYRLVYDYTRLSATGAPVPGRLVYPALVISTATTYSEATVLAWLTNPNNPYTLAALRPSAHLDYVVMSVVRCLLAYADTEFTADTSESVDRARSLYELAARLLKQDITQYAATSTAELLDPLDALFPAAWLAEWQSLKAVLARTNQRAVLEQVLNRAIIAGISGGFTQLFGNAKAGNQTWALSFERAWQVVNGQLDALTGGYISLCAAVNSSPATTIAPLPFALPDVSVRPYVPFRSASFCVPTNPVPFALALQAELNLFKIRSCRNIAGVQRELDPYAAATDTTTGLPTLSSTGQLVRITRLVVPATPYRYAYIMERARNLVALAQQTEASLLAALEKRDAEAYNQLKARQDIAVSQATVQLQSLRVTEAEDGVDLAGLQLDRSQIMQDQYSDWLSEGLNEYEQDLLDAIQAATKYTEFQIGLQAVASAASATGKGGLFGIVGGIVGAAANIAAGAAGIAAAAANGRAQLDQNRATYQRRADEWNFQKNLAAQDIKINQQQIKIANDQVKVVGQEKRISQLQLDHATVVLTFLTTKFTNAELYDWMSGILQSAYSYFLQQATATARLAEQQLAFERQQVPGGIVQADYYSDPVEDATYDYSTSNGGSTSDRRGLTGSVRLLQDLTRLDEYAFETTKRKLQLSKTISLAQSFPTEFVRFRDTGVVSFACQPEWFDQDFPGHYLRVLRRVRTSVIALVPTVDGIKARLSTAGTSHVTVDGAPFQTLTLPRGQEVVALTSPSNATGLFELDQQGSELLLPFEGLGVDVPWQFSMQPASNPNLDYSAVADVLITLDYSALESASYASQVVKQLGTERQQQVVLSMRDRFADQWYDLHHADEVTPAQQYVSTLTLTADDLPRNLRGASVTQVSLYVDAPLDDELSDPKAFADRSHLELRLTRGTRGGAAFTNQYGLISTRTGTGNGPLYTGNAGALVPLIGTTPAGEWTLTIGPGRLRDRLAAGLVNDIYLILEVEGDVPAYML